MNDNIKIINTASPFLKYAAREIPKETRKAVKSAGWWMQQEIKKGIASGAPGGQPYAAFSGLPKLSRVSKKSGKYVKMRRRTGKKPLGRLGSAIRYKFYSDSIRTIVGWISPSAEKLGQLHEKGGETPITSKMRKLFYASGIGLSRGKTSIKIPRRPTIGPEYERKGPQVPGYIEKKIWGYLEKAGAR